VRSGARKSVEKRGTARAYGGANPTLADASSSAVRWKSPTRMKLYTARGMGGLRVILLDPQRSEGARLLPPICLTLVAPLQ
jgi:hypothetical protein